MNICVRLLSILIISCLSFHSLADESLKAKKPIRIVTSNWTSQIVLANVTGEMFRTMGYPIEYLSISTAEQWGALAHGVAHVQVEVWEGTMSDMFNQMVQEGGIVDVGTHGAATREEWWYPQYVEQLCPGLPDWKALKSCAQIFSTPESAGKGVYFAGPWEKPGEARIRALGLNFDVHILPNGDDLWVELERAHKQKKPIVLFNWTPNWVESRYAGDFIEFPVYSPECETNPSWGVSKSYLYDCGNPKGGWLKKAAWSGMEKTRRCAFQTLENINFDNKQISDAAALVDVDKLSYESAAQHWLNQNEALWKSWIPAGCIL
ncbi:glycine/betaine ABC transporter substrate-binding protein [Gammaproteobacteria bacterium 42_54_T18]|nr:glycine/betaine ABC transporter substrate-binding protein [Gammaproteobacteria bacterium 42_54_T18]